MFVERNDSETANPVGVECSGLRVASTPRDFITGHICLLLLPCFRDLMPNDFTPLG